MQPIMEDHHHTVRSLFGLDDRPRKMTTEQLNDFVQAVADLKSGGIHQKSGHYKNAWVQIAQMLKDKHNAEYSVEYLRSQWHLRLKVTRRRFYAVTETLTENGVPVTEENVDNEMLKENALCKPCDRIIYLHFRSIWMSQRQIKTSEMNDSSVPEPRLPSPEDEVDTSFFSNYALGMDALNMTDSIKLLLNSLPPETLSFLKPEVDVSPEPEQCSVEEPKTKKCKIEVEEPKMPVEIPQTIVKDEGLSAIAENLSTIANATVRVASSLEGIHNLLKKLVPQ